MVALLSSAYLAPIQYFTKLILYEKIVIEKYENYTKQTYRNRCKIYSANGGLTLSIPVMKTDYQKIIIKDLEIDQTSNWQKIHWRAIESAYYHSPFFEYYLDDFIGFYTKKYKYLIDFNFQLEEVVCKLLEIQKEVNFTDSYYKNTSPEIIDLRYLIHPKPQFSKPDIEFITKHYHQVFSNKFGFLSNLSIIDLLFNEGPFATAVLKECITKP